MVSSGHETESMLHPYQRPSKSKHKKPSGLTHAEMTVSQQKGFKGGEGGKGVKGFKSWEIEKR